MASVYRRSYRDKNTGKTKKCKTYTIELSNGQRVKGYTDKLASDRKASQLETALARGEQGLLDPFADHKKRPLTDHLKDYLADLRTMGRDDKYRDNVERRLKNLFAACRWSTLPNITLDSFSRWRESSPVCGGKLGEMGVKASGKTLNQYLETARAFGNWCVKRGRISTNPLTVVEKVTEKAIRPWRALTLDEARRLLAAPPEGRRIVYLAAMTTGLRRSELESLQWGDVHLFSPLPFLKLRAAETKARRADTLAIKGELSVELKKLRPEDASDTDRVFAQVPSIKLLRNDLVSAEIPWHVPGRGFATFHGLRKTKATMLAMAGVPERIAMEQMRLTDRRLLDDVYTDSRVFNMSEAVEKLPTLLPPTAEPHATTATGTEGGLKKTARRLAGRLAGKLTNDGQSLASTGSDTAKQKGEPSSVLPRISRLFNLKRTGGRKARKHGEGRNRTYLAPLARRDDGFEDREDHQEPSTLPACTVGRRIGPRSAEAGGAAGEGA